jgi:hypothetical protein
MCARGQAHAGAVTHSVAEARTRRDDGGHGAIERANDGLHRAQLGCGDGVGCKSTRCRQSMPATRRAERRRGQGTLRCAILVGVSAHLLCFGVMPPGVSGQVDGTAKKTEDNPSAALGPLNELCKGFSANVAGPIKGVLPSGFFYSPGWAGSPRAFFNAILTGPAESAIDCEGGFTLDGTACSYASFFTLMIVLFGVLIPIGTTIYCMGFCCARTFIEKCHCCCALCKQPNCGSHRPTYDYDAKEKFCVGACTILMALVFIIISLIGFLATLQVTSDFGEMVVAMQAATEFPEELSLQLNRSFVAIDSGTQAVADRANDWTADGVKLTAAAEAMNNSLKALIANWQDVKKIVEGTTLRLANNPCGFYYNGTTPEHRAKYDGVKRVWVYNTSVPLPGVHCCERVDHNNCIFGSHPRGMPTNVVLEDVSIAYSPTCADLSLEGDNITGTIKEETRACPCCCTCQQNIDVLEGVISRLPRSDQLTAVTPVIDAQILSKVITGIGKYLTKSISTFKTYILGLQTALEPVGAALSNKTNLAVGAAGGWLFACLGAVLALCAWLFVNVNCWWVGYVCGWMTFFLVSDIFLWAFPQRCFEVDCRIATHCNTTHCNTSQHITPVLQSNVGFSHTHIRRQSCLGWRVALSFHSVISVWACPTLARYVFLSPRHPHATGVCACLFSIPSLGRRLRTICIPLFPVPQQSLTKLALAGPNAMADNICAGSPHSVSRSSAEASTHRLHGLDQQERSLALECRWLFGARRLKLF